VRRLGWGYFTLEAEIVLKEPYKWIVGTAGSRPSGLELTWTLDFTGSGRQGRVRAHVRRTESESTARALRATRRSHVNAAQLDEDDEMDDESSSIEGQDEEASEFIGTPRR
jgi:hypothetical protein